MTKQDAQALHKSMKKYIETVNDHDPEDFPFDPGCVVCTAGVTPDRYNTGLCMYHQAQRWVVKLRKEFQL